MKSLRRFLPLSMRLVGVHMGFITVDAIKEKLTVVVDTALSGLD